MQQKSPANPTILYALPYITFAYFREYLIIKNEMHEKNYAKSVVSACNASTGLCSTAHYNISGCAEENPI